MKNIYLKNVEALFLDFDGVIIDSTDIKTKAFYDTYIKSGYSECIAKKALEHHITHQGISRYKKFSYIHEKYLNSKISLAEKSMLSLKFSEIILEKIFTAPLIRGVLEFLSDAKNKEIPVFLLSATPVNELKHICLKLKIDVFFKEIYGSPQTKKAAGNYIIEEYSFNRDNIFFIGDSNSDYEAALDLNVNFIGKTNLSLNPFNSVDICILDFSNLIII